MGLIRVIGGFCLLSLVSVSLAWGQGASPEQRVGEGIEALTEAFEAHKADYETDPAALYAALERTLDDYVDFRRISASVMGRYFRAASPEQRSAFVRVFRDSLVRTFGRGLMSFDYREFDLELRSRPMRNPNQANVELDVLAANGQRFPVVFVLEQIQEDWKIVNVVVNGINLGLTFRSQFEQAMEQNRRDFDRVIAQWTPDEALQEIQQQVEAEQQ